ncbi:MAG: hypothetical protein JAZ11_13435 [Candidatus Thiodiazotropha lotti]|nr:hypothetical protein [Candidatus Thiodiazotropha lotti]
MDERFGSWLRDTMADIDEDILKKRWSAVESLASDLDLEEMMDVVLFCANNRMRHTDTLDKVKRAFWAHDNAFDMKGSHHELRRLCGAIAIHMLKENKANKMGLSLASTCLYFGGLHTEFGLLDMALVAEETLQHLSTDLRSSATISNSPKRLILPSKIIETFKAKHDAGQWQESISDLDQIFMEYGKTINQLAGDNVKMRTALEIQKEETDILWWLTAAYSNDMKQSFQGFDGTVVGILAGKELADHVMHPPGPLGAASILSRMMLNGAGKNSPVSLESAVRALPIEWRQGIVEKCDNWVLDFCPLLKAIFLSIELGDEERWIKPFSKLFPYDADVKIEPAILAFQMYREWVMALEVARWD